MNIIAEKTKVRLIERKPLPSGATVQLVGFVWYIENGLYVVRIATPGMYGGGIYRLRADEIEAI